MTLINNTKFRYTIRFLLFLLLTSYNSKAQIISFSYEGIVVGIKDGDTIEVLDENKQSHTVRLAEIDCPEKNQAFGNVAKNVTSDLVYKNKVRVEVIGNDRYNREIGKVYYNGHYLSLLLIESGVAWHYKKYSNSEILAAAEVKAKKLKKGLWADDSQINPEDFRHR